MKTLTDAWRQRLLLAEQVWDAFFSLLMFVLIAGAIGLAIGACYWS